jgi:hypothetical protein
MKKLYMFLTDAHGDSREVPVDPAHLDRQTRDYEAAGYTVTVLDEDERINYGLLAQQLSAKSRGNTR